MKKTLTFSFVGLILIISMGIISSLNLNSETNYVSQNQELIATPLQAQTMAPSNIQQKKKKASCVVIIKGNQYDVTSLKKTHSGGDIFTCGTDMSNSFFSTHNQKMLDTSMKKYLIK